MSSYLVSFEVSIPNRVVAEALLEKLGSMMPQLYPRGGAQRSLTLVVPANSEDEARATAQEAATSALGSVVKGAYRLTLVVEGAKLVD